MYILGLEMKLLGFWGVDRSYFGFLWLQMQSHSAKCDWAEHEPLRQAEASASSSITAVSSVWMPHGPQPWLLCTFYVYAVGQTLLASTYF